MNPPKPRLIVAINSGGVLEDVFHNVPDLEVTVVRWEEEPGFEITEATDLRGEPLFAQVDHPICSQLPAPDSPSDIARILAAYEKESADGEVPGDGG